uniref:FAD-binding domain-containing protein n=1 Tax=Fusarium oxysporum (strain Fo5176) TaxID=660025 RepID=A0A0D2XSL7_FUSOF
MSHFKIIIVGGGLAGALLANGLVNNGVDAQVFERDEENLKREGYQIRLSDAALSGLEACLSKLHMDSILEKLGQSSGSSSTAPSLTNTRFETVLDLSTLPTYSKSAAINRVVLRDLLLGPLIAGGKVKYGKCFSHYEIVSPGRQNEHVKVNFTDGSSETCDLLVAADGSGSKLPHRLQKGPILVFKNGVSLYYARKTQRNDSKLDFDEDEASFYWALSVPRALCPCDDEKDIPDRRQFCLDIVRDWALEYHAMLSAGSADEDGSSVYVTRLRASSKLSKQWRQRLQAKKDKKPEDGHPRVWLVGDAVHAMQPNRGMGGNQAMEDIADILPELLELKRSAEAGSAPTTEEIQTRCHDYEKKMIDRAFVWVAKSGGTSQPILSFLATLVLPVVAILYKAIKRWQH